MVRASVFGRLSLVALVCVMFGYLATPVSAQPTAVVRGKVVDEAGKPVEGAEVRGEFLGAVAREWIVKTDKKGEFLRVGVTPGPWKVTATKDKLIGMNARVDITLDSANVPPITLGDPKKIAAANMSAKEVEAENKKRAELAVDFETAKAAFDSSNFDGAIVALQKILVSMPTCAACYLSLGDAYNKKNDLVNAETAYQKSIELDATKPGPYAALATIYNGQKKFEEAGKMSAKANELSEAGGGGGNAQSVYNQGVILWNQSKPVEAEAQFLKATTLDPKMADAFYWLGMARVNQGKLPDAKAPFLEYMKLAPTGPFADQVKAMLAVIK